MKVLHIINEARPSGAEVMLRAAGSLWKQHGVQCDILATGHHVGPFASLLENAGYRVHHLPRTNSPKHFLAVKRFVAESGYHCVHQHLEAAGYWYASAALAGRAGVVRTVHNNFLFDGRLRVVRGWQRRHLAKRGVQFVAISPGVRDNELSRFGVNAELVLNWIEQRFIGVPSIDERREARRRLGYSDDAFVVVSVGNCSETKNHKLVLDALVECKDMAHLRYLHIGVEDAAHSEQSYAKRIGVSHLVRFLGPLDDVRQGLYAADAFVMPSVFEGVGIAAIEAMATGLPTLLSRVHGLADLEPIFPGILYFELNGRSLEGALRTVAAESIDGRQTRAVGYQGICNKYFSASRGVDEYVRLYRLVASK